MKEAEDVVEVMIRQNISPNVATYNTLIDKYCSQGQMDKAKEIFHFVVDQGLEPDIITYNSLIKGYCTNGKVDEAWCLFLEVPDKGLQHTAHTYSTIIHGLFREGRFAEGWDLFNIMEDQQIHPELVTYTILFDGLLKDHQIDKAFSFLRRIEDRGFHPNIITYGTLVKGLCADGRVDAARHIINRLPSKGLLREMEENGCSPCSVTYNFIIRGLLKSNTLYWAMQFLKEMIISGFVADSSTVSLLLDKAQKQKKGLYAESQEDKDCLGNFKDQNEFYYEKGLSKKDKWWIPTPKVPPNGLSEVTRKWLQYQKDSVHQVLKAAMAINAQVLTEMEIPGSFIEALPKNVRASLGDAMYKSITDDFPYPDMNAKDSKSPWGSAVSMEKREIIEDRAETILPMLKHGFPEISKIKCNRDAGHPILASYSRIIESLAFTVLSGVDDVMLIDSQARVQAGLDGRPFTSSGTIAEENGADSPSKTTLLDFMGWEERRRQRKTCKTKLTQINPAALP
ncbi:hypothetical protein C2S52_000512 [Perilla frutescens var. hirtella]|nr:hypothetical protein C2S52_000512 [Perilla frutescens var. hirtella]